LAAPERADYCGFFYDRSFQAAKLIRPNSIARAACHFWKQQKGRPVRDALCLKSAWKPEGQK
jgi:hypothetical protein